MNNTQESSATMHERSYKVEWKSPSNIALIKYWGKKKGQIPMNPSLSLTLKEAYTQTSLEYAEHSKSNTEIKFFFEGEENEAFKEKIQKYFELLSDEYPILNRFSFVIRSRNSFPHSTGIASSASSMSALALCITDFLEENGASFYNKEETASRMARLGSGSACRSIFPGASLWGESKYVEGSTNTHAVDINDLVREEFLSIQDSILIVDSSEKAVSSTAGHALMEKHFFKSSRIEQVNKNLKGLIHAMKGGDWKGFIEIVELEALTLHALMMSSSPSYILMRPNTLSVIERVRAFRKDTDTPLTFTLDAGPNVHLLYPEKVKKKVRSFIENDLIQFCEDGNILYDRVGKGPQKIDE